MGRIADELSERSKSDNAMIVGSEIREAIAELQAEVDALKAERNAAAAMVDAVRAESAARLSRLVQRDMDIAALNAECEELKKHSPHNYVHKAMLYELKAELAMVCKDVCKRDMEIADLKRQVAVLKCLLHEAMVKFTHYQREGFKEAPVHLMKRIRAAGIEVEE